MKLFSLLLVLFVVGGTGCKDADRAQLFAQGKKHKVTLYSGGIVVRTWHSTGSPINEAQSDGWYFKDQDTGTVVEVTGTVVFEVEK